MIDEKEFRKQIRDAKKLGELLDRTEPRAVRAEYDTERGIVMVELKSGCWFGFPPSMERELDNATPEQIAAVEIHPGGEGLHWEELDADISVPGLIFHLLNAAAWCPRWIASSEDCPQCQRQQ
jgi:hypothetical protein